MNPEPTAAAPTEQDPVDLVEVASYPNSRDAFEHGLVVLAIGSPFWLVPGVDAYRLLVPPSVETVAREQLMCFDRERITWPSRLVVDSSPRRNTAVAMPWGWLVVVLLIFWAQNEWTELTPGGLLDARALFDRGELWRPFTALFLHGDFGHLISNALSGVFVFSAVLTTFGRRRGWGLILLAAVLGNVAAAAVADRETYRSLGASTAIFAGVGVLTGRAVRVAAKSDRPHRWRSMLVPLGAGGTVLALFGAGGVQIDVLAHFTGFLAGLAVSLATLVPATSTGR